MGKDVLKGAIQLLFPLGEWVILCLTLVTWAEKRSSQRFFLSLMILWIIGKCLEGFFPTAMPWHWHFARLAVMLFFWRWAWVRSERRILPLLFSSIILSIETLFLVNEPGIFPYEPWLFAIVLLLSGWLTAKSYWGTAAAFVGSILLNQVFVRFTYDGIVRYADLPDSFIWNFGVGFLAIWAGLRFGWQYYSEGKRQVPAAELLSSHGVGAYENSKESENEH
jgi:hypothetical protein